MAKRKTKKSRKLESKKTKKITKNMKFSEVLNKYPQSAEVMANHGLHCIGCQVASFETIEQGAKAHGMNKTQLNKMMNDLNKVESEKKIEYKHKPIPKEKTLIVKEKPKKKSFFKKLFGG